MIKAYFVGISSHFEGEDIVVKYSIFRDEELLSKETVYQGYVKPAVVNQAALATLLQELKQYKEEELTVIMNDPALDELLRGVSQTKNKDVLKMLKVTKDRISRVENPLTIKDVSQNKEELDNWNRALQ